MYIRRLETWRSKELKRSTRITFWNVLNLQRVHEVTPKNAPQTNRTPAPAAVSTSERVPAQKQPDAAETPKLSVTDYIKNEVSRMSEMFEVPQDEMMSKFLEMRQGLINAKIIPDIKSKDQTMEQAQNMIDAMYKNFTPSGKMKK